MIKENSNKHTSAKAHVLAYGEDIVKKNNIDLLSPEERSSLTENYLHIHDFENFATTLNCVSLSAKHLFKKEFITHNVKFEKVKTLSDIFSIINIATSNISNEISGGISWVNFDQDLSDILSCYKIPLHLKELEDWLEFFFKTINFSNIRGDQTPYVSLSIGIVKNEAAAKICNSILNVIAKGSGKGRPFIFPNIQFRIKNNINASYRDPYYHLLQKSLSVTAIHMNPTYILCDSPMNRSLPPEDLHIVGCRSRLLNTSPLYEKSGIGRTNLGVISINLPKVAHHSHGNIESFYKELDTSLNHAASILMKKNILVSRTLENNIPTLLKNNLLFPFKEKSQHILSEASLSIGFIGGAEAMDYLYPHANLNEKWENLTKVITHMREFTDLQSTRTNKIFTLIGVSGEGISYKFYKNDVEADAESMRTLHKERGYYTNSFHIPVDKEIRASQKIALEGNFHTLCNGGGISYIEISHVQKNITGLEDLLKIAQNHNCNYVGFNFPKNICNDCGTETNNVVKCTTCNGDDITLIRRVSGYLGYLSNFSHGKKMEEKRRVRHTNRSGT